MDRLGCVDLFELPLQLLLRRQPGWLEHPVAVVDREDPRGRLLHLDRRARRQGLRCGTSYGSALSLVPELRAGRVTPSQLEETSAEVFDLLGDHSPHVERDEDRPGVFWLDAAGFDRARGSFERWGEEIEASLRAIDLWSTIVVGFGRFGPYAAARRRRGGVHVFASPGAQRRAVLRTPLVRLGISRRDIEALAEIGVRTIGELMRFEVVALRERFGPEVAALRRRAGGVGQLPLQSGGGAPRRAPASKRLLELGYATRSREALLGRLERELPELLGELEAHGTRAGMLHVKLLCDGEVVCMRELRPARSTLEPGALSTLARLWLDGVRLARPVDAISLEVRGASACRERADEDQGELEALGSTSRCGARRSALGALDGLRAEFGDDAVVRARPIEAHLPEARFEWEPCIELGEASADSEATPSLVRRVHERPRRLGHTGDAPPEGWVLGAEIGPIVRADGPHLLSGGWWGGETIRREYYHVETARGDIHWVFFDRARSQWFVQGRVD
jgi:protein ImuB